ncbi:MAG: hypothetical protein Q8M92_08205, partial [Candidatus Subteraquimicrobiales bacterium]|nr:hypothetical protein [Candidatus Subteraquimicrobiales bacterium]
ISSIKSLADDINQIIKHGYFFLSTGDSSDWWVDLVELDRILENEDKFVELNYIILSLLEYLKESNKINTVILPRWTSTTEDWFVGTLYRLRIEKWQQNFEFQEIIKLGKSGFYVRSIHSIRDDTKSLAILGLSAHDFVLKNLIGFLKTKELEINLKNIISIIHRNGMKTDFENITYPIFLADKNGIIPFTEIEKYREKIDLDKLEDIYKKVVGYLFTWEEIAIEGKVNSILIDYLRQKFGFDWTKTAKVEINRGKTIKVSKNNYLLLKLNDEKTSVSLEIDDGRTEKFIAKMEDGKLNIYIVDNSTSVGFALENYNKVIVERL